MKDPDEISIWLLIISAVMFLISTAVLAYACVLLMEVRHKIQQFSWRPPTVLPDGRRRQERI